MTGRQTGRYKQVGRQADIKTGRQADAQTQRKTDSQDWQTDACRLVRRHGGIQTEK